MTRAEPFGLLMSLAISGIPNAAVLPVPVWADPRMSLPFIACGIASSWIGVGSLNFISDSVAIISFGSPISSNLFIFFPLFALFALKHPFF